MLCSVLLDAALRCLMAIKNVGRAIGHFFCFRHRCALLSEMLASLTILSSLLSFTLIVFGFLEATRTLFTLRPCSHGNAIVRCHLYSNFWNGQVDCSHENGMIPYQFWFGKCRVYNLRDFQKYSYSIAIDQWFPNCSKYLIWQSPAACFSVLVALWRRGGFKMSLGGSFTFLTFS